MNLVRMASLGQENLEYAVGNDMNIKEMLELAPPWMTSDPHRLFWLPTREEVAVFLTISEKEVLTIESLAAEAQQKIYELFQRTPQETTFLWEFWKCSADNFVLFHGGEDIVSLKYKEEMPTSKRITEAMKSSVIVRPHRYVRSSAGKELLDLWAGKRLCSLPNPMPYINDIISRDVYPKISRDGPVRLRILFPLQSIDVQCQKELKALRTSLGL